MNSPFTRIIAVLLALCLVGEPAHALSLLTDRGQGHTGMMTERFTSQALATTLISSRKILDVSALVGALYSLVVHPPEKVKKSLTSVLTIFSIILLAYGSKKIKDGGKAALATSLYPVFVNALTPLTGAPSGGGAHLGSEIHWHREMSELAIHRWDRFGREPGLNRRIGLLNAESDLPPSDDRPRRNFIGHRPRSRSDQSVFSTFSLYPPAETDELLLHLQLPEEMGLRNRLQDVKSFYDQLVQLQRESSSAGQDLDPKLPMELTNPVALEQLNVFLENLMRSKPERDLETRRQIETAKSGDAAPLHQIITTFLKQERRLRRIVALEAAERIQSRMPELRQRLLNRLQPEDPLFSYDSDTFQTGFDRGLQDTLLATFEPYKMMTNGFIDDMIERFESGQPYYWDNLDSNIRLAISQRDPNHLDFGVLARRFRNEEKGESLAAYDLLVGAVAALVTAVIVVGRIGAPYLAHLSASTILTMALPVTASLVVGMAKFTGPKDGGFGEHFEKVMLFLNHATEQQLRDGFSFLDDQHVTAILRARLEGTFRDWPDFRRHFHHHMAAAIQRKLRMSLTFYVSLVFRAEMMVERPFQQSDKALKKSA